MNRIKIFILCVLLFSSSSLTYAYQSLFKLDFKNINVTNNKIGNYLFYLDKAGTVNLSLADNEYLTGRKSLLIEFGKDGQSIALTKWIKITPDKSYRLSYWYKKDKGVFLQSRMTAYNKKRSYPTGGYIGTRGGIVENKWAKGISVIHAENEGERLWVQILIKNEGETKGRCYLDDIRIEECNEIYEASVRYNELMLRKGTFDDTLVQIERMFIYEGKKAEDDKDYNELIKETDTLEERVDALKESYFKVYGGKFYAKADFTGDKAEYNYKLLLIQDSIADEDTANAYIKFSHEYNSLKQDMDVFEIKLQEYAKNIRIRFNNLQDKLTLAVIKPYQRENYIKDSFKEIWDNITFGLYHSNYLSWYRQIGDYKNTDRSCYIYSSGPGKFDFKKHDEVIEKNKELGLKTLLYIIDNGHSAFVNLPDWLYQKYGDEIYLKDQFGNICIAGWGQKGVNIWHPGVREFIRDWLDALSKHYSNNENIFIYSIMGEPQMTVFTKRATQRTLISKDAESAFEGNLFFQHEAGYNRDAVLSFRKYLCQIYKNISKLNLDWSSNYKTFDEIDPPDDHTYVKTIKTSPLKYHFERFIRDSLIEFIEMCYDSIKKNDKNHPVSVGSWGGGGMLIHYGLDNYKLFRKIDFIGCHTMSRYFYDLHRYYEKPLYVDECGDEYRVWNISKDAKNGIGDDHIIQANGTYTIWRGLMLGSHGMNAGIRVSFPRWAKCTGSTAGEVSSGQTLLRKKYRYIPRVNDMVEKIGNILLNSEIKDSQLALFIPSLSLMSVYADTPEIEWGKLHGVRGEMRFLENEFIKRNYSYNLIIEEAALSGKDDLDKYKVIVIPYGIYFPDRLAKILTRWIKRGGTLISIGPCGIYDKYGRSEADLLHKAAGVKEVIYNGFNLKNVGTIFIGSKENTIAISGWSWKYKVNKDIEVIYKYQDESPAVFEKKYGKGKIIVTGFSLAQNDEARNLLYTIIDDAILFKDAYTYEKDFGKLFMLIREDRDKNNYLFILNTDIKDKFESDIFVKGACLNPIDLCVDGRYVIRNKQIENCVTRIPLVLQPGQGTVIYLGQMDQTVSQDRLKSAKLIREFEDKLESHQVNRFVNLDRYFKQLEIFKHEFKRKKYGRIDRELSLLNKTLGTDIFNESISNLKTEIKNSNLSITNKVKAEMVLEYAQNFKHFDYLPYLVMATNVLKQKKSSVIDITLPRTDKIMKIDGKLAKWQGIQPIEISSPFEDLGGCFRIAYDSKYLYMVFDMKDRVVENNKPKGGRIWDGDCIEVFIDTLGDAEDRYNFDDYHFILTPTGIQWVYKKKTNYEPEDAKICTGKTEKGYVIEYKIAFKEIGLKEPLPGYTMGFNLRILDCNTRGGGYERELMWKSSPSPFASTKGWGKIKLK